MKGSCWVVALVRSPAVSKGRVHGYALLCLQASVGGGYCFALLPPLQQGFDAHAALHSVLLGTLYVHPLLLGVREDSDGVAGLQIPQETTAPPLQTLAKPWRYIQAAAHDGLNVSVGNRPIQPGAEGR